MMKSMFEFYYLLYNIFFNVLLNFSSYYNWKSLISSWSMVMQCIFCGYFLMMPTFYLFFNVMMVGVSYNSMGSMGSFYKFLLGVYIFSKFLVFFHLSSVSFNLGVESVMTLKDYSFFSFWCLEILIMGLMTIFSFYISGLDLEFFIKVLLDFVTTIPYSFFFLDGYINACILMTIYLGTYLDSFTPLMLEMFTKEHPKNELSIENLWGANIKEEASFINTLSLWMSTSMYFGILSSGLFQSVGVAMKINLMLTLFYLGWSKSSLSGFDLFLIYSYFFIFIIMLYFLYSYNKCYENKVLSFYFSCFYTCTLLIMIMMMFIFFFMQTILSVLLYPISKLFSFFIWLYLILKDSDYNPIMLAVKLWYKANLDVVVIKITLIYLIGMFFLMVLLFLLSNFMSPIISMLYNFIMKHIKVFFNFVFIYVIKPTFLTAFSLMKFILYLNGYWFYLFSCWLIFAVVYILSCQSTLSLLSWIMMHMYEWFTDTWDIPSSEQEVDSIKSQGILNLESTPGGNQEKGGVSGWLTVPKLNEHMVMIEGEILGFFKKSLEMILAQSIYNLLILITLPFYLYLGSSVMYFILFKIYEMFIFLLDKLYSKLNLFFISFCVIQSILSLVIVLLFLFMSLLAVCYKFFYGVFFYSMGFWFMIFFIFIFFNYSTSYLKLKEFFGEVEDTPTIESSKVEESCKGVSETKEDEGEEWKYTP